MQPGKAPYKIHEWSDPSAPGGVFRMGVLINRMKCEECGWIVDRDCGEGLAYRAVPALSVGDWPKCARCKKRTATGG